MMSAVGIDLGTTYSAVAVLGDDGQPRILVNRDGDPITPSVVLFQSFDGQDEPIVGTMAKHSAASDPDAYIDFVKRFMGDPDWKFDSEGGTSYGAVEISAIILKRLKEDAELALGEPVTSAVITVPAYFDDARRTATRQAGTIAGLEVLRVLNEPTAAALSFGLDALGADDHAPGTVLVYDLGGGTFDVTVMRITDGVFDVIATDGDRNLGGFDFDNALISLIAEAVQAQGGPDLLDAPGDVTMLREKAEMAKRSLTTVSTANVHLSAGGQQYRVRIERADFERATADLLARTRDLTESVLEEASLRWADVDHVLLVGGSTRMPMVRAMVEGLAGRPADRTVDPDQAVALGAAVQASMERTEPATAGGGQVVPAAVGFVVQDVTSQSLGVITLEHGTTHEVNSIIIPRNSKVPSTHSDVFTTTTDGQTGINVQVTEGDDSDPEYVTVIREELVPIPPYPRGARVRVTYHYDIDQTVFIEVEDLTAGVRIASFETDARTALSDAQVAAAATRVSALTVS
ncbi:Hsp70 family protein [Curtobacterium pusillum]|uniref:Hsp70 family protein n=2 Tax=Curtobacterium pusillum TaxID=69373 RepID=A0ABX2M7B7_9MICO|nr:Hsp70 family protein [Curtobacterium pusillum]